MAQIIKHRRGTAAQLKTTTLYKGELGVSTGSVAGVTTPVLHVGDGTNAAGFVVGRLFQGSTVPTLNSGDIGASLNDMLFHDSATYKLYRLNSSGNENLDLTGNIADRVITGSLTIGTAAAPNELLHVYGDISSSGNIHAVGNITFEGGSSGTIELGSDAGDNVVLKADVSSSIIPNNDDTWDLGKSTQQWKDIYIDGTAYVDTLSVDTAAVSDLTDNRVVIVGSSGELEDDGNLTFDGITLSLSAALDVNGDVDIDNTLTAIDSSGGISLDAGAASNLTTSAGALTLSGAGGVTVTSTGGTFTLNGTGQTVDLDGTNVQIDASSAISLDAGAASNFTTTGGAITINGATGISLQKGGTDVIAIDTNQDVLFSRTEGSTSDPDVEFDGYVRFDGTTEVANDTETSGSGTGAFQVDGGVNIAKGLTVGGYAIIDGNLTVKGTQTYVSSSVVDIGDNIINLNALGAAVDGGIQVLDASGSAHTGSMLWNAADDYWYSGISGSTHYRVPQQSTNTAFTANKVLITDANGRIEVSDNITDNDTTVDFNDVDLTSIDKLEGIDTNTYIDIGGSTLIVTKGTLQPASNGGDDLGATETRYANLWLSANADIDGTLNVQGLADFQAKVHAYAGLEVTGSAFISAGASVEATGSSAGSLVAFRNTSNTQLGYLASAVGSDVTSGLIGYNESNNNLVVSNVIDGGSF
jgi:hypothetical protein